MIVLKLDVTPQPQMTVSQEFLRDRHLILGLRQPSCLKIGLVQTVGVQTDQSQLFLAAVYRCLSFLEFFRLGLADIGQPPESLQVVVSEAGGGDHLHVVEPLGLIEAVGCLIHVLATCPNARQDGHAQSRDQTDGQEALPAVEPRAQHIFDSTGVGWSLTSWLMTFPEWKRIKLSAIGARAEL